MRTCVVKGCKSKSSKGSSVRFHAFPSDETRRQLWWSKIQPKRTLKDSTTICELHFKAEDYDERNRLNQDAVPGEAREKCVENCDGWSAVEEVCRICLASDRKVFSLRERRLQQAYNDVSGITVTSDDRLPQVLCWECCARVLSAARCQSRARAAHRVLEELLETYGSITRQAVSSVNRRANKLTTQLHRKYINSNDEYVYISEDLLTEKNDMKPLHKVDIKNEIQPKFEEFIVAIHDIDEYKKDVIEDIGAKDFDKDNDNIKDDMESDAKNDEGDDENDVVELVELNSVSDDDDDVKSKNKSVTNDTSIEKQVAKRKRVRKPKGNTMDKPGNKELLKDFTVTKVNHEEEIAALERRKDKSIYKNSLYKCEVCYRGYMSDAKYQAHILKHTDKYGAFECSTCKTRYATKGMLRNHTAAFHLNKYNCNKCPFVTNNQSSARHHVRFHDGIILKCPHCPRQFQIPTTYYSHLRLKHACAEACEYCGHTFLNKFGAARHKNIVHKFDKITVPLEGPYCDPCDVKFASQQAYDTHLIMSSNHRKEDGSRNPITNAYRLPGSTRKNDRRERTKLPIDCEQCGLTLGSRSLYAWHFKKKHPGLTRTRHPVARTADRMCEQCGRKFVSMAHLEDHKWVHTGEKNFKCDLCGKTFIKKANLALHMKVHNASRPSFECPLCGKLFAYYNNRKRHMFIHTGLRPYKCGCCGKSFTTSGEQRSHIEHVHLRKPWPRRIRTRGQQTQPWQKDPDHT